MISLKDFTFNQISLISQLDQVAGVRDLARKNFVDAAAVSRLLKDFENKFNFKLALRSAQGLTLTSEGQQVVKLAKELILNLDKFESLQQLKSDYYHFPQIHFGSRGFLTHLTAGFLAHYRIEDLKFKIKFFEASSQDIFKSCLAGVLDVAVHLEPFDWPKSWASEANATLTWGLVARFDHPIKTKIKLDEVKDYPFVGSSYLGFERIERSADVFSLKWSERKIGHESQSAATTKAILLNSEHIAYLPLVTIEDELRNKDLKLIKIVDSEVKKMNVFLSVNQDRVSQKAYNLFKEALHKINKLDQELAQPLSKQKQTLHDKQGINL